MPPLPPFSYALVLVWYFNFSVEFEQSQAWHENGDLTVKQGRTQYVSTYFLTDSMKTEKQKGEQ